MKSNFKKVLCTILALVLCIGVFGACGGNENSSATPASTPTESKTDSQTESQPVTSQASTGDKIDPTACEETMDLSVTVLSGFTQSDSWMEQRLEEKYNVNIELIVLPGWTDGPTKLNTLMASDDIPDVIWWGWDATKEYEQWKNAGLLADVSEYVNKYTVMRDYWNENNITSLFYETEADGSIYRLPAAVPEAACQTLMIRQDWLDNLGLEVPTTVDELNEILRAFTEDDPDGNGKDDTYGLGGRGKNYLSFWPWVQSYDYTDGAAWIVDADGKVAYGPTTENTKLWLGEVADLFAKGYIMPNIVTANDFDQVMANGGFGVTYAWCTWNEPKIATMQSFYEANPGAKWVAIDMVTGKNGHPQDDPENAAAWCKFAITTHCSDPERAYATWDDMGTRENYIERIYGLEGEHYKFDADGNYEAIVDPEGEQNQSENIGLNFFFPMFYRTDDAQLSKDPATLELFDKVIANSRDRYAQQIEWQNAADLTEWLDVSSDIIDECDQYMWGVIAGERSIDEWDSFIATLNGLGLEDAVAQAQTIYDEQSAKMQEYMDNKVNQG